MVDNNSNNESIPRYTISELNESIGLLLSRGFAPIFTLSATVSKAQIKKGHLWLTLTDGKARIDGVVWSSRLKSLKFLPKDDDGVLIVGKLNFWESQARISVQIFDIRASISTVLKKFEIVRSKLIKEGLIDKLNRKELPKYPKSIGILTSVPSSALADILRTAKERWPLTKLFVIPIPVQGNNQKEIMLALRKIKLSKNLRINALVIARGGGSREDLMLFDNELLAREIATFPIPIVTGIGHEDDLTIADLVSDHRSATPTAAIVDLLPSRAIAVSNILESKKRMKEYFYWFIKNKSNSLMAKKRIFQSHSPLFMIKAKSNKIKNISQLFDALSPSKWLKRGFSIVTDANGKTIFSVKDVKENDTLSIQLVDGKISTKVDIINYDKI